MPRSVEAAKKFAKKRTRPSLISIHDMDDGFKNAVVCYPKSWGCHQYLDDHGVPDDKRKEEGMKILASTRTGSPRRSE